MGKRRPRRSKPLRSREPAPRTRGRAATASSSAATASALGESLAHSVVYIHGIGSHAPASEMKRSWDAALFGQAMADTELVYWSDIRHPAGGGLGTRALRARDKALERPEAKRYVAALQEKMQVRCRAVTTGGGVRTKVFRWFPGVGDALFDWMTNRFIKDTAAYFFDPAQRRQMQGRLIDALDRRSDGPIVLIAHSQGSIIAYDVLRRLDGQTPSGRTLDVAFFVTLGSPLGIDEIQRKLTQPLEIPKGVRGWANFADPFDPVALDKGLAGEFKGEMVIHDTLVRNPVLLNPHSAVGYLSTPEVRTSAYSVLGWNRLRYGSRVRKDVLNDMLQTMAARELDVEEVPEERHPVLIELRDPAGFGDSAKRGLKEGVRVKTLAEHRQEVVAFLQNKITDTSAARIDPLHRFVAGRLTASEIHMVDTECMTSVYCVWKNSRKRALIRRSAAVVQVPAARTAYNADGAGVTWAILDTGVQSAHPHFDAHSNIATVWDCTNPGPVVSMLKGQGSPDAEGHGTHVAGIIAGGQREFQGLAPKAKLHVYKVLDDAGFGEDGWIIKAIDHIAETNNASADLTMHGINLSLGGPFDPDVYGCGHSPICQELRRLWRQGLMVCVACGNEGALDVSTPEGTQTLNTFLSIGDPANLDDCVAVGSVHADRPHTYGISYFSSRGPTADGRSKPDLVAPGEVIWSCNAHFTGNDSSSEYIALSGTSMAAPHVSGLVAAFLSVRREFLGRPDEVKRILLANCTDLGRDQRLQGAGMPNLVKMLANT